MPLTFSINDIDSLRRAFYELGNHVFIVSTFNVSCHRCGKVECLKGIDLLNSLGKDSYECSECANIRKTPCNRLHKNDKQVLKNQKHEEKQKQEQDSAETKQKEEVKRVKQEENNYTKNKVNESAKPFVQNTVQENYGIRWWNDRIPLPYTKKSNVRKELFIHWYYVDREKDDLTDMETFHVNMLYRYNVMERFDSIHINIATDSTENVSACMRTVIDVLSSGKAKLYYKIIKNDPKKWEGVTINDALDCAEKNKEETHVYYTHFKGVTLKRRHSDLTTTIDIMYWCFLMYKALFDFDGVDVDSELHNGKTVIGLLLKNATVMLPMKRYKDGKIKAGAAIEYMNEGSYLCFSNTVYKKRVADLHKKYEYVTHEYVKKNTGRYAVEGMCTFLYGIDNVTYMTEDVYKSGISYHHYTKNFCPKLREEFNKFCRPSILVYSYAENLSANEYEFNKVDGVDYILYTDHGKSNYTINRIDFKKGKTSWERNKWYKWNPANTYDYVIYRDISMDIEDVYGLIESATSEHGINVHKHPSSKSIENENIAIANHFRKRGIPYDFDIVKNASGELYSTKTDMAELTLIVYNNNKLDRNLLKDIWEDFMRFGAVRDQPSFRYTIFRNNLDISSFTTLPGHVPWNIKSRGADTAIKRTQYYKPLTNQDVAKIRQDKFKKFYGYEFNKNNIKTFEEKNEWFSENCDLDSLTKYVDKIDVRDYAKGVDGLNVIPLLGTYDKFDDIDLDSLPDKFIIKCNHDSGSTKVYERGISDVEKLREFFNNKMSKNYYYDYWYEPQYAHITPKIIVEKFMGDDLYDYKFYCFDGKVFCASIQSDTFTKIRINFFDRDFNDLKDIWRVEHPRSERKFPKPDNYDELVRIAEKLAEPFSFVRVDLYNIDGKIFFGELTFTPGNCRCKYNDRSFDLKMGSIYNVTKSGLRMANGQK